MIKAEFLKMMKQDLETEDDSSLHALLVCFEEVLKPLPATIEIDPSKTVEDCYKKMYEEASKNKTGNSYCFTPKMTEEFILTYLDIEKASITKVNLEDFF